MDVIEAITGRRSVRGFSDKSVGRDTVEKILAAASRAPSGSNIQPWKVHVVAGKARDRLCEGLIAHRTAEPDNETPQYQYYPVEWREPYIGRRRAVGWGLYNMLGIGKGEREKAFAQELRNYDLFGAPVGLFFTVDEDMEQGSWLDCGMFIENVMLAARGFGLETCPQAAWVYHHKAVRDLLPIPPGEELVCGMALGYEDPDEPANRLVTEREPVNGFATFNGF